MIVTLMVTMYNDDDTNDDDALGVAVFAFVNADTSAIIRCTVR